MHRVVCGALRVLRQTLEQQPIAAPSLPAAPLGSCATAPWSSPPGLITSGVRLSVQILHAVCSRKSCATCGCNTFVASARLHLGIQSELQQGARRVRSAAGRQAGPSAFLARAEASPIPALRACEVSAPVCTQRAALALHWQGPHAGCRMSAEEFQSIPGPAQLVVPIAVLVHLKRGAVLSCAGVCIDRKC
jgi:hypothetical protein